MATPAAILSVLVKANTAQAQAALGKFDRQLKDTDKTTGKWKGRMAGAAKVAGVGMAAGVGVGVVALKGLADAAIDSEKSNARMRAQLKASGIDFGKHADHINKVIERHSKLSALDDEDLQDSFTNIVRVTGDVNKALRLNALAADFARAKNMDVAKAGELVGKVAGGNTGILSRYGIAVKEGATAQEALGLLQQKFAGQAKAFGDTSAGASDRFKVAVENLQEALGARLLPVIAKVMNFGARFVNSLTAGSGAAGGFGEKVITVWETVRAAVGTAITFLVGLFRKHRDDYRQVREAAGNVGKAIAFVWAEVVLPVVRRVLPAIVQIIRGAFTTISGIVKTIAALLTGDWRRAWEGVKQIFRGAIESVLGMLRAITAPVREAASRAGAALRKPFVSAFDAVKNSVGDVIDFFDELIDKVETVIDFIGDIKIPKIDIPFIGGSPRPGFEKQVATGGTGGTYAIANRVASMFGLRISSGYRSPQHNAAVGGVPNSLHTHGSSGNPGAIDLVGSSAAMYAASAWAARNLRLAENLVHDVGSGLHFHMGFFRKGGKVPGAGSGDTVPAMLEPGEFVMRKKVVDKFGPTFFAAVNGMKSGGFVSPNFGPILAAYLTSKQGPSLAQLEAAKALADLTDTIQDDLAAGDALVTYWQRQLALAQTIGKPAGITAAAQGLKGAQDFVGGIRQAESDRLAAAIEEANRLAAERKALDEQIAANQKRIIYLSETQGPQIVGAVVAAVNGSIGGRVGLGFQGIRSNPGSVAGL